MPNKSKKKNFYSFPGVLLLSGIFSVFAFFTACSEPTDTAGNSAEIGNPEIAGVFSLPGGSPAAKISVRCVPEWFKAGIDTLPKSWITETDSSGYYRIDSLPESKFALEASIGEYSLLKRHLSQEDSSYSGELSEVGGIRLPANGYENGDSILVTIPGTTFLRYAHVIHGEIFLDSLPASSLTEILIEEDTLTFEEPVEIPSGEIIKANEEPLTVTVRFPLNGPEFDEPLKSVPLALRLDSSVNLSYIQSLEGRWEASLKSGATQNLSYAKLAHSSNNVVFWVLIDSLPMVPTDTILLTFTEGNTRTYDKVFSSDDYIAVWHFDEGVLTADDASGNRLHGSPYNVEVVEGVLGESFHYNGKDSYVTVPSSCVSDLDFAYSDDLELGESDTMSISVWVNADTLNTSRFVYGKGSTQYHLKYYYPQGWLFERYRDIDGVESKRFWFHSSDTLDTWKAWTNITVTQLGSTISMYVDGELVSSSPSIGTFEHAYYTGDDFEIGRQVFRIAETDSSGQYFLGSIDELHVMRNAISEARIKVYYLNQKPVDYWPKALRKE